MEPKKPFILSQETLIPLGALAAIAMVIWFSATLSARVTGVEKSVSTNTLRIAVIDGRNTEVLEKLATITEAIKNLSEKIRVQK